MESKIEFTDETIQQIFGHEAAEDEDKSRLKDYYFKNSVYDSITSDIALRILVGHKGIGKSALITVAMQEDQDAGNLAILVRPDDVSEIETKSGDFLSSIRNWKIGLSRIIAEKVVQSFNIDTKFGNINCGGLIQGIVNTLTPQLKAIELAPSRKKIIETFLAKHQIRVYIDDLDRGWNADRESISRLSALLNALRDMPRENAGLQFKVALRSDVYYLVRTSDESTDKIEGSVVWHMWSNHEILAMLVKRIESFLGRTHDELELLNMKQQTLASFLNPVIAPRFLGYGGWANCPTYRVLMSLIRKRPRDLVKLCTLAAHKSKEMKRDIITTESLDAIFSEYSQGRLQDTTNEYRSELPKIERLLIGMKPSKKERRTEDEYLYTTDELILKIKKIIEQGNFYYFGQKIATPNQLAEFLYKINFLTARKDLADGTIIRKYFEENRYIGTGYLDFGYSWEIHPAYRWALQPDNPKDIYKNLSINENCDV